jgi:hypothetical protein
VAATREALAPDLERSHLGVAQQAAEVAPQDVLARHHPDPRSLIDLIVNPLDHLAGCL